MKKILIVAYHFPPAGGIGAAGSQRMHKFSKYFPSSGWQPIVLTVKESAYESYLKIDSSLLKNVSPDLLIIRTGVLHALSPILRMKSVLFGRNDAQDDTTHDGGESGLVVDHESDSEKSGYQRFKDRITDLFEIPDEVAGWLLPAILTGAWAVRKQKINVIFATGRPWTSLVVGAVLKLLTGRPLVVDFRDPWMTNPFRVEPSPFKSHIEERLESWVVKSADLIVANTDALREEFIDRFGSRVSKKCITIMNGFDVEEFSKIEPKIREEGLRDAFVMLHTGFLYGKRDPKPLIDAIKILHDQGALASTKFRCDLIGSVELPYNLAGYIRENSLESYIHLRGEVSYAESIASLAACDLALLLQPGTATQIPSKVFEYIGLGKRILTVAPTDSAVARIVIDHELGDVVDPDDVEDIARAILQAYCDWMERKPSYTISSDVQAKFNVERCVSDLNTEISRLFN